MSWLSETALAIGSLCKVAGDGITSLIYRGIRGGDRKRAGPIVGTDEKTSATAVRDHGCSDSTSVQ